MQEQDIQFQLSEEKTFRLPDIQIKICSEKNVLCACFIEKKMKKAAILCDVSLDFEQS